MALLVAHRPQLDALATALMDHETLDETEVYAAALNTGFDQWPALAPRP